jgi:hypothetical protein
VTPKAPPTRNRAMKRTAERFIAQVKSDDNQSAAGSRLFAPRAPRHNPSRCNNDNEATVTATVTVTIKASSAYSAAAP